MITEGFHIPDEFINHVSLTKGTERSSIVSDVCLLADMPEDNYSIFGLNLNIKPGNLVKSPFTKLECLNYMASLNLVSECELERLGFYNPLCFLGIDTGQITTQSFITFSNDKYSLIR